MRTVLAMSLAVALTMMGFVAVPTRTVGQDAVRVSILNDLGDGEYFWRDVVIEDPSARNASWSATQSAASALNLAIEWAWFDCCGVAVVDIGDRNPPAGFAGLYLWNATAEMWDLAPTGISDLVLRDGDAIAWYNAGFDGTTYEPRFPVPTPAHRNPSLMFRGSALNTGVSRSAAPNAARVLWDRDMGVREIVSTPAVAYGRLFFATFNGTFALDAETGQTVWHNPIVRGFSSPAVFDGTILLGASDGHLYRLYASNGTERWTATLLEETVFSGITSSPKVAFDHAYVGTFNESGGPGEVVAVWVSNGTIAWRHATGSVHFSSPAVANGTVYVGVMGRYNTTTQITFDPPYGVLALDAATGGEVWFFETGGPVAASPAIAGSLVLAPSKDGFLYALDRNEGDRVWRANVGSTVSSPAVHGDTVFVASGSFDGSRDVRALDIANGQVRWTFTPNGPVQASITYADGKIFFSTNAANGTIYALNATRGEEVWKFQPTPANYILGSPIVADGTLYAPSDNGHVYAIRDPARQPPSVVDSLWAPGVILLVLGTAVVIVILWRRRRVPD